MDMTGNWSQYRQDTDGDGDWELDQTRTHNAANEIVTIGGTAAQVSHDRCGNMTKTPSPLTGEGWGEGGEGGEGWGEGAGSLPPSPFQGEGRGEGPLVPGRFAPRPLRCSPSPHDPKNAAPDSLALPKVRSAPDPIFPASHADPHQAQSPSHAPDSRSQ